MSASDTYTHLRTQIHSSSTYLSSEIATPLTRRCCEPKWIRKSTRHCDWLKVAHLTPIYPQLFAR